MPARARAVLGVAAAVPLAAIAALVLGEYELDPGVAVPAGAILGLLLGEVAVSAGRTRHLAAALVVAVLGAGALVWAGWIDGGRGLEPIKAGAWMGAAVAGVVAAVRVVGVGRLLGRPARGPGPGT